VLGVGGKNSRFEGKPAQCKEKKKRVQNPIVVCPRKGLRPNRAKKRVKTEEKSGGKKKNRWKRKKGGGWQRKSQPILPLKEEENGGYSWGKKMGGQFGGGRVGVGGVGKKVEGRTMGFENGG